MTESRRRNSATAVCSGSLSNCGINRGSIAILSVRVPIFNDFNVTTLTAASSCKHVSDVVRPRCNGTSHLWIACLCENLHGHVVSNEVVVLVGNSGNASEDVARASGERADFVSSDDEIRCVSNG